MFVLEWASRTGDAARLESRTLIVTLLGVPLRDGDEGSAVLDAVDVVSRSMGRCGGSCRSWGDGSELMAAGNEGSADMLLWARSPLSRRGRFLLTESSASAMGLRGRGSGS